MADCTMSSLFIAIGAWVLITLLLEWSMWKLFRRKFTQICLPTGSGQSLFHFFTIGRMRILAILHTILLLALIIIGHILLWS